MNQGYDCECHVGFVGDGVTCRGTIMIGYYIIYMSLLNAPCLLCLTIFSDALTSVMSVVGGAIALVCLLSLVTIGGIKIKRYCNHRNIKFNFRRTMNIK